MCSLLHVIIYTVRSLYMKVPLCTRVQQFQSSSNDLQYLLLSMQELATVRYDLSGLLKKLSTNIKYDWIANRIKRLWPQWSQALFSLQKQRRFTHYTSNVSVCVCVFVVCVCVCLFVCVFVCVSV